MIEKDTDSIVASMEVAVIEEKIAPMFPEYEFGFALKQDQADIMKMYHAMIGTDGCTWNQDYPNAEDVERDIQAQNLFVLRGKELIAVISIDQDQLVDELENWTPCEKPTGELARLAVHEAYQNQGIARKMILAAMEILKVRGYAGARYLVSPGNKRALASYHKLSFCYKGDCEVYDHKWNCYELLF